MYIAFYTNNKSIGIWDLCPEYFTQQQEDLKIERNPLYKFLLENTKCNHSKQIPLNEIRERFGEWLNGTKVKKLDQGTFFQVNPEYTIEITNICKHCKEKFKAGCCNMYNRKDKSSSHIVNNIEWI